MAYKKQARSKTKGPFKFTESDYTILETWGGRMSQAAIGAKFFRISKTTMERALKVDPSAKEALERGRHKNYGELENVAYDMAYSGKNSTMTMFMLKTKVGYRETQRVEITGADGGPVQTQDMTKEERQKKIDKLLKYLDTSKAEKEKLKF